MMEGEDVGDVYSVGELAALSGVTVRTLHHYEEQGLLVPKRLENGYRAYGLEEVDRLQQILIYRELGMHLSDIRQVLDDPGFEPKAALAQHLEDLKTRKMQIDWLIKTVEKTLGSLEGGAPMSAEEKFEAFKKGLVEENEAKYGEEVRGRWGDDVADAANDKMMGLSRDAHERTRQLEEDMRREVLAGLVDGDPDGHHAQSAAALHAEWLQIFWPDGMYTRGGHAGLAEGYLADQRFKDYYDAWAPGAAEFLVAAIKEMCAS